MGICLSMDEIELVDIDDIKKNKECEREGKKIREEERKRKLYKILSREGILV